MKGILLLGIGIISVQLTLAQTGRDYFFQGCEAYRSGDYDQAIALLNKAVIADQSQPAFWNLRGTAKAAKNDHSAAIEDYNQALSISPDNPNYHYNKGVSLERVGSLTNATTSFNKALELKPDLWPAVSSLGNIALEYEDFEKAIPFFQKASQLNPEAYNPYNNLAYALNQLGRYQEAIANAQKAIGINDKGASAYNHLSFAYFKLGNLERAIQSVNQSIAMDPLYAKAYYTRALIHEQLGQPQQAIAQYEKSVDLTPPFQAFYYQPFNALKTLRAKAASSLPPQITISSPDEVQSRGFKENMDLIKVTGNVARIQGNVQSTHIIRTFTVNGNSVLLDGEGYFNTSLPVSNERSEVSVIAIDNDGQKSEVKFAMVRESTVAATEDTQAVHQGENFAIVIGMADYDHPQLTDLNKPILDARLLAQTLAKHYDFPESNIRLLENPSRSSLFQVLEAVATILDEEDNLLIFYAGHGHWDEKFQNGYWLLSDATPYNRATWFSNNDLKDFIRGIKTKHTLLITDACFSGSIFIAHGNTSQNKIHDGHSYDLKSRNAMTSGALKTVPDESAFLKYLVMRLEDNEKAQLRSQELFQSLRKAVMLNSDNVPQYGTIQGTGSEFGDFIFFAK